MLNGIHTGAVRLLFQSDREVGVLVPVERAGPLTPPHAAQRDMLCLLSSSSSGSSRGEGTRGQGKAARPRPGFNNWSSSCGTLDQLKTRGIATTTSSDPHTAPLTNPDQANLVLHRVVLVPDNVARVTVRLRNGQTVRLSVHDNTYRYVSDSLTPELFKTTWFDVSGQVITH
jgi:hypothetical protein